MQTGLPRQPQEYFDTLENPDDVLETLGYPLLRIDHVRIAQLRGNAYADYLDRVLEEGTSGNGVFGAKMMWGYFDDFLRRLRQLPGNQEKNTKELLSATFPGLHYIWVVRRDKERQAVSLWKAIQTQQWRKSSMQDMPLFPPNHQPTFHLRAISYLEERLTAHEQAWNHFFQANGLDPLIVVYEEMIDSFEETLFRVLRYLNIPLPEQASFTRPVMHRQADALSEKWIHCYRRLKHEG